MYTLNLLVNFFDVVNGRFSGDATTPGALNTSMNWLKLNSAEPADPNPPAFNPERADWTDIGQAGTLFIPRRPVGDPEDNICIRVAPDPDASRALPAAAEVLIVVSFGRSVRARQERASPFIEDGGAKTTFIFPSQTRNTSAAWFMPLGQIAIRPNGQNQTHRYEFSVGVIVSSGGVKRHFGEDPEMDVGN
jgi:hypothetical protein